VEAVPNLAVDFPSLFEAALELRSLNLMEEGKSWKLCRI